MTEVSRQVERWVEAGVIDRETAARIRTFEEAREGGAGNGWLVRIALVLGGVLLASGVLLFVAAHWDSLSPAGRFTILIVTVGIIHTAAALVAPRAPGLATTLHGVGTVALGGGIFLAGQIFNLEEHWATGFLLWTLGAAAGWWLLRDVPQLALFAALAPVWLVSEWIWRTSPEANGFLVARIASLGVLLLALAYLSAVSRHHTSTPRRVLGVLGAVIVIPAAWTFAITTSQVPPVAETGMSGGRMALGWLVAIGVPAALAMLLRGRAAWPHLAAVAWTVVLVTLFAPPWTAAIVRYAWWGIGAIGLVAWGVRDGRLERINLGFVLFASTVLAFYFSTVMDRLGRSASLISLGLVFLAGGWALERSRRRLIRVVKGAL